MHKLVYIKDERVVIDSLTIASQLGRKHKLILLEIRKDAKDSAKGFYQETYYLTSTGKKNPMYVLDLKAFLNLMIRLRGKKVSQIKEQIVNAFTEMAEQLNKFVRDNNIDHKANSNVPRQRTIKVEVVHKANTLNVSPRERIKFMVSLMSQEISGNDQQRSKFYLKLYKTLLLRYGFSVFKQKDILKAEKRSEGLSEAQIEKLTYLDVLDAHPEIWSFVHQSLNCVCKELKLSC